MFDEWVDYAQAQWQRLKAWGAPKIGTLWSAVIALATAAYTFKISVQTAPIILSVVTVLATLPLISLAMPGFLFAPAFILPILIGISAITGYYKYKEIVQREKLDELTEKHEQQITEHTQQLTALQQHNQELTRQIDAFRKIVPLPSRRSHRVASHEASGRTRLRTSL